MTSSKKRTNRKYDSSFKADVIKMIASGRSYSELSTALGISGSLLRRWFKAADSVSNDANKKGSQPSSLQNNSFAENERLRSELRRTEQERDILKKALGIFSRGI